MQIYLQHLTTLLVQDDSNTSSSSISSTAAERKAYTKATLRWHPDKFLHRLGKWIVDRDREEILAKVKQISQEINVAWSQLQEDL